MAGREPPWLCFRCGYMCDAFSCFADENAVPKTGDLSICLNCGAEYWREADRWRPLTAAERNSLDPEARRTLFDMRWARSNVITDDLTKRDRRA